MLGMRTDAATMMQQQMGVLKEAYDLALGRMGIRVKEESVQETNHKRVLGIVGSPRRGGNTETLVNEALRGAEEAGGLTEKSS